MNTCREQENICCIPSFTAVSFLISYYVSIECWKQCCQSPVYAVLWMLVLSMGYACIPIRLTSKFSLVSCAEWLSSPALHGFVDSLARQAANHKPARTNIEIHAWYLAILLVILHTMLWRLLLTNLVLNFKSVRF